MSSLKNLKFDRRPTGRFSPAAMLGMGNWFGETLGNVIGGDNADAILKAGTQVGVQAITGEGVQTATQGSQVQYVNGSDPWYKTTAGMIGIGVGGIALLVVASKAFGKKKRRRR